MSKHIGWRAVTCKVQSCRPKECMEIQNIFTDEVILLGGRIWPDPLLKVQAFALAVIEETGVIANRCIKPHVKIFAGSIRNLKAKVGGVTGDIPVT